MILILGGTTEGRLAVRVADAAGSPYWYSTRGDQQQIECKHGTHISGALDEAAMAAFCTAHGIRLLVDAAHPFAVELHRTVAAVAESLDLPVVRVERVYADPAGMSGSDRASLRWCDDYADAIRQLEADGIDRLLALTGVQTIGKLRPFWSRHTCWFRILRREESLEKARQQGFPEERLAYYEEDDDAALIARLRPEAILTKESGESGGFGQKLAAARAAGIPVYAVRRPALPAGFEVVTGEHGLRKAIERLVPDFFPLRSGFTTGACATAAAKAALLALLGHPAGDRVEITFPDGEILALPVADVHLLPPPPRDEANPRAAEPFLTQRGRLGQKEPAAPPGQPEPRPAAEAATATVIKDAGDDPDVTNGYPIVATVAFSQEPGIHFLQGEGVGRVTLPGLGLPVGGPAINRVPRQMMERELTALCDSGLDVTISVPGGRELAGRMREIYGVSHAVFLPEEDEDPLFRLPEERMESERIQDLRFDAVTETDGQIELSFHFRTETAVRMEYRLVPMGEGSWDFAGAARLPDQERIGQKRGFLSAGEKNRTIRVSREKLGEGGRALLQIVSFRGLYGQVPVPECTVVIGENGEP